MYILLTPYNTYFVEYLIGQLILSTSIEEAMIFENLEQAYKFQRMLWDVCQLNTSVNTYIL
tara:strand:- start:3181 stop:3363 length:183 start_codon:yes stop_codon:yes gene_type:complete